VTPDEAAFMRQNSRAMLVALAAKTALSIRDMGSD
jgi:hypothetical protein